MPRLGEVAHHREHLADEFGIERRRRLVEQHQPRRDRERAGDGDALLLAAGQSMRQLVRVWASPTLASSFIAAARGTFRAASP